MARRSAASKLRLKVSSPGAGGAGGAGAVGFTITPVPGKLRSAPVDGVSTGRGEVDLIILAAALPGVAADAGVSLAGAAVPPGGAPTGGPGPGGAPGGF